ncbi:pyridoxamine 5'-phosphate oxidase family protein [Pararhizobium sp.]|uniref:pyridoxamine 5'-phosphate oxidase family protein n=1 Tax=Pararhizobium sp. TaxID=1977563 RepID=UPI00271C8864|nr:pyridoxamine 5'-phosphate oxidase family protein [Pararhizobium sp.]MDO9415131.1 pyridoxamine 5'-phosphate oxidase family protein [Pararhizobium sp.]
MTSLTEARENPKQQLFDQIHKIHAGMLGLEGSGMHMQPMAPNVDEETGTVWFYTRADSDLAQAIGQGARAHFCVIGKDHDYHACLGGHIEVTRDPVKIDEYWNSVVEAWFQEGKRDPDLTMLALHLDSAEIWASTGSSLKFGWEIAKANLTDSEPDVGVKTHVTFNGSTQQPPAGHTVY